MCWKANRGTVMVVESNIAMQDMFRDRLKKRGYRVLIISDPDRAQQRLEEQLDGGARQNTDCVIFSASELGQQAVEGFNRLATQTSTKSVPAILLLDPKQRSLASQAQTGDNRAVLIGPKLSDLRTALIRCCTWRRASRARGRKLSAAETWAAWC